MQMNKGGASRLISLHVPDDILRKDLEIFRQKALDLGIMIKVSSAHPMDHP